MREEEADDGEGDDGDEMEEDGCSSLSADEHNDGPSLSADSDAVCVCVCVCVCMHACVCTPRVYIEKARLDSNRRGGAEEGFWATSRAGEARGVHRLSQARHRLMRPQVRQARRHGATGEAGETTPSDCPTIIY